MWYMRMRGALCGADLLHHAKRNESHARMSIAPAAGKRIAGETGMIGRWLPRIS
jgi:hypothetical protein